MVSQQGHASALARAGRRLEAAAEDITEQLGGRASRRAVLMLGAVLGVQAADTGAVGALAPQLQGSLHIGNTALGLLVTAAALIGAFGTVPAGSLVDRISRTRLLYVAILVWAGAELLSAFAFSYPMLLAVRMGLGAVTAVAGPAVASLTGDLFPARDRSRIYGFILTGELVGAGAGVLVAGLVSGWFGWRASFAVLVLPSAALACGIRRWLHEPARGGQSPVTEKARIDGAAGATDPGQEGVGRRPGDAGPGAPSDRAAIRDLVAREGAEAHEDIIPGDPAGMTLRGAVRWVLRVRSNVILIVSGSLGYFFLAGLETFALLFVRGHYHLGQSVATLVILVVGAGAVAGAVGGGRLADRLIARGRLDARLLVGALGLLTAAVLLAPALLTTSLFLALPLFVLVGAAMSAPNPALDAARLDVVPFALWGRAEGVRSLLRNTLQAFAPLLFGVVSSQLGGGASSGFAAGVGHSGGAVSAAQTRGLQYTFLVMLAPMVAGAVALLLGRRYYPTDVASAAESERRARARNGGGGAGGSAPGPAVSASQRVRLRRRVGPGASPRAAASRDPADQGTDGEDDGQPRHEADERPARAGEPGGDEERGRR